MQSIWPLMMPPTVPALVEHAAAAHPFLREHLALDAEVPSGRAYAHFHERRIQSGYQPIFDVSMNGMQTLWCEPESADRLSDELGFQALTLQPGGRPFDPFESIADGQELIALDRLARALHAINFFGAQQHGLLFLRVHECLLKSVKYDHGQRFSSVLVSLGLNPARIVIELPSAAVAHRTFLGYLTANYQRYGFKVAGNLPNAGHVMSLSDMARLDFLKIDGAAVLRDSMAKPLLAYANRLQIPVIFDRVATQIQFDALQQLGARFVQGALFETQGSECVNEPATRCRLTGSAL